MNIASTEDLHRSPQEPLETRKNHNEPLLQEDALMFLLQSEHLFTHSNFTLVAHPSATSEGSLYHSGRGFSRTDVLGSQYRATMPAIVAPLALSGNTDSGRRKNRGHQTRRGPV